MLTIEKKKNIKAINFVKVKYAFLLIRLWWLFCYSTCTWSVGTKRNYEDKRSSKTSAVGIIEMKSVK